MTEKEYITQLENRCHDMAEPIITRLCKRAMREMNQLEASLVSSTDDYPPGFKFIDILSIELQDTALHPRTGTCSSLYRHNQKKSTHSLE